MEQDEEEEDTEEGHGDNNGLQCRSDNETEALGIRRGEEKGHKCRLTCYHAEDSPAYNRHPMIMGKECSQCSSNLRIKGSSPVHICRKHWHGWDRDGEGGRSGKSGPCNLPFLCDECLKHLLLMEDVEMEDEGADHQSRKRKRRRRT